jgi:hypothetical protein
MIYSSIDASQIAFVTAAIHLGRDGGNVAIGIKMSDFR